MKVVIVGGVAGGASCAARLRRLDEDAEIMLIQSGPDVSFASCGMPYFIGGEITDRTKMSVQTPESLRARFDLDVRVNTRVTKIDIDLKTITAHNELTGEEMTTNYDELVLAVGAAPFRPSVPGIDRRNIFTLRNLTDMDNIVAWINKQHARKEENSPHGTELHCIVGGAGFVGLEMVEQLIKRDMSVTLVEKNPQVLTPLDVEMAGILSDELQDHGVAVITGDAIAEFKESLDDPESTIVQLESGKVLPPAQLIILGLGVRPDTKVIQEAGINCTNHGHVVVDESMRTSVPHVWAVGDSIEVRNPILPGDSRWAVALAGPANRQGRMVADNIRGNTRMYKGTYGAAVIRVFKLVAACVGVNEKILKHKGLPYSVVHVHPGSHAGYFPGAKSINFKLIFNPHDGTIYGAQAIGEDGVEKRIDVISTAMQGKLKVEDLAELELCYAPPVGSAKDPVNIAGMAAQNIIDGLVTQIDWKDLDDAAMNPENVVLDVRNPGEIKQTSLIVPNAVHIPLDDLRKRLHELPKDKNIIVSCASGQRAYYACRVLMQNGFKCNNLSGAYRTYSTAKHLI